MNEDDPSRFRILVVDDRVAEYSDIKTALNALGDRISLTYAEDVTSGWSRIQDRYYDLVILDLYDETNDLPLGVELYRLMSNASLSSRVLFISQFELSVDLESFFEMASDAQALPLAGFVDKRNDKETQLLLHVTREVEAFEGKVTINSGVDETAELIHRRRSRFRTPPHGIGVRESLPEIAVELERLLRDLLGLNVDFADGRVGVNVALSPVSRHGLSTAVAVNGLIQVAPLAGREVPSGHQVVLKFGPKDDIKAERDRFLAYVRYGVELAQRVELLGWASRDVLGGIIYSLAGAPYGTEFRSLDELMVSGLTDSKLASSVSAIGTLFDTKNWYSIEGDELSVADYYAKHHSNDLRKSYREAEKQLLTLDDYKETGLRVKHKPADRTTSRSSLRFDYRGHKGFDVPNSSILGWDVLPSRVKSCLVHGDLHGGNVLVEDALRTEPRIDQKPRICLIDFRDAGPGPRCVDAVALESSIRLADVEAVKKRYSEADDRDRKLTSTVFGRYREELHLYGHVFGSHDPPRAEWAALSCAVLGGLKGSFSDISLREYLAVSMRYSTRILAFKLDPLSRLRIAAWFAAQYTLAKELDRRG